MRDLASLGEALAVLPALAAALTGEDGGPPLGRVAAHIIGRVAAPASLDAWIALARTVTVRALRDAVKQARDASSSSWPPGSASSDARSDEPASGPRPPSAPQPAPDDDPAERSLVRLVAPAPLLAVFDETLELYRSVEGSEASVTSFVEALIAESFAGDHPPGVDEAIDSGGADAAARLDDSDLVTLRRGTEIAAVESGLARSTDNWRHLPRSSPASGVHALAVSSLARLDTLTASAGQGDPVELDAQVRALMIGREVPLLVLGILGDGPIGRKTEAAWVTRAEEATVKRLRDEARALGRRRLAEGRRCPDPPRPHEDSAWHASLRREPGIALERILAYGTHAIAWADETGALPIPDVFLRLRLPHEIAEDFVVVIESYRRHLAAEAALDPWGFPLRVAGDRPSERRGPDVFHPLPPRSRLDRPAGTSGGLRLHLGRRGVRLRQAVTRRRASIGQAGVPARRPGAAICPSNPAPARGRGLHPRRLALFRARLHIATQSRGSPHHLEIGLSGIRSLVSE